MQGLIRIVSPRAPSPFSPITPTRSRRRRLSREGSERQTSSGTERKTVAAGGDGLLSKFWQRRQNKAKIGACAPPPRSLHLDCASVNAATAKPAWEPGLQEQYDVFDQLGHGSAGVVYRAARKGDGKQVAVKTMQALDEDMTRVREDEFRVLVKLSHPSIIRAIDFFVANNQAVLVMEFFQGSTLTNAVRSLGRDQGFSESVAHVLSKKLLQAVDYLHGLRIVHRDVKGDNVLVNDKCNDLRLADFNTAKEQLQGEALTMTGTQEYAAPEVLLGSSPGEGNDVWCAGLCMHLMLSGRLPRRSHEFISLDAFAQAVSSKPVQLCDKTWGTISEPCKTVVRQSLALMVEIRPTASELLSLEWLGGSRLPSKES
eukprot:gb/GFBE01016224.1/.p1 GENE.gb/GFBE01016224.1/~~gb/GFBE01016224.1/.p1  ORF type:complete len:371 (+),score=51.53 gb/GFBE01016224.1/:1-1113(+)